MLVVEVPHDKSAVVEMDRFLGKQTGDERVTLLAANCAYTPEAFSGNNLPTQYETLIQELIWKENKAG